MVSKTLKKLLSLLTAFAMVFSLAAMVQPLEASAATVDLSIANGGFENGAFGGNMYAQGGAAIVDNKDVHSGNYAVHLIHGGENGNGAMDVTVYPEVSDAERTLTISFWMMCKPGAAANSIHYGIFCFDSDWGQLSSNYGAEYATVDGNWYKQEISLTAPANTKFIQVQLYTADAGTAPYLDDISVVLDGTELMTNGGLENGQLNGGISSTKGTIEVVKAKPVHSGTYAAHADMATSGGVKVAVNLEPSAEERSMTFSFWAYAAEVDGIHTQVACFKNDGTDPAVSWDAEYVTLGVWEQKSFDITVPANTNYLEVLLYANQPGADFYIDDIALTETLAEPENQNITVSLNHIDAGDNWYLNSDVTGAGSEYYRMTALVDGAEQNVMLSCGENSLTVWANFFDSVPTTSFVIPANTVLVPISPDGVWHDIEGATLTITNGMRVEKTAGAWVDMSQYSEVSFADIKASDLTVYKWEDQSANNYRSVFAISSNTVSIDSNADWSNFTLVGGSVLVDGNKADTVFGMLPADDAGWGAENAMLLYIVGEGYRDAVTTASSVTVTAGTTLISGTDATHGYRFTEDFTMYKNCDGTWDTTADTHVYNQQNTELEGALVSTATCQSPAVYYYSCSCGAIGTETFTYGELGEHNYVDGVCDLCGEKAALVETTLTFLQVTGDGTWQFSTGVVPGNQYYKFTAIVDGEEKTILASYSSDMLLIYPDFFRVYGSVPVESLVIPAGTMLKAVDSENGWAEIENATALQLSNTLDITLAGGAWVDMSPYQDTAFTEIHASDLDVYYQEILRLGDITDDQLSMLKLANKALYNTAQEIIAAYGRQANRTTIGIKSVNPALTIPSDASWSNFTVLGSLIVNGADPADTYIAMTPNSASGEATGMDNAFLLFFYNGYVLDNATSVTIPAGTRIIAKDGTTGFVFAEDYTVYRKCDTTDRDDYRKNQHTWNDTEGYHYPGQWTQTVAPAYKVPGQETTTCTKCGETLNREIPALTTPVTEWNVTLGENIGVRFILGLTGSETVTAAVNGVAVDAPVVDGVLYLNLPATQMADEIVISIDGEALAKTYSVRGYAEVILAGNYSEATKNLVKYMLSYGSAAQTYFGYNTENPADRGITVEAKTPTGDTTVDYSGRVSGIAFYSASLLHRNKTAVRFYFAGSAENLTFTVNGVACEPTAKDDMYYVELAGINPQELENDVTVVVSDGTDTLTVHYSPLDYIVRMYEKETSSPQTKALVQALYGYYLAAEAYTA